MIPLPYLEIKGPEGETFQVEIQTDRLTIGRFEQWNDVALWNDPQQLISRKVHCYLEYERGWWIVDNGSVNRLFLRKKDAPLEMVQGRAHLTDGDTICLLGRFLDNGQQAYWELTFRDPAATSPAGYGDLPNTFLEYHWLEARLYRSVNGSRTEILNLRPQEHKLLRYMAHQNRANHQAAVVCPFEDLSRAVWGEEQTHSDADLAHLIWQLRKKIEPDPQKPQFLHIVRGVGYRLQLKPFPGANQSKPEKGCALSHDEDEA